MLLIGSAAQPMKTLELLYLFFASSLNLINCEFSKLSVAIIRIFLFRRCGIKSIKMYSNAILQSVFKAFDGLSIIANFLVLIVFIFISQQLAKGKWIIVTHC